MSTGVVQLNTRIDASLKQSGDAVLARNGFSASEAVRALWEYVAQNQAVPSFMERASSSSCESKLADSGAGLATRVAAERCGYERAHVAKPAANSWGQIRDGMYDDILAEMEQRCR